MVDSLGRRNHGFSFINSNGLNSGHQRIVGETRLMHVRVSDIDQQLIAQTAKAKGVSMAELIRTYITWGLEVK